MAKFANKEKQAALSRDFLCSILSYCPETGIFEWAEKRGPNGNPGHPAGYVMKNGYRIIRVNYAKFLAGRLAWFYVHGVWPDHEIDHINHCRDDNRIENLRPVTRKRNMWNLTVSTRTGVGILNISQHRRTFRVQIVRHGKKIIDAKCKSLDAAISARDIALRSFHDANQSLSAGA